MTGSTAPTPHGPNGPELRIAAVQHDSRETVAGGYAETRHWPRRPHLAAASRQALAGITATVTESDPRCVRRPRGMPPNADYASSPLRQAGPCFASGLPSYGRSTRRTGPPRHLPDLIAALLGQAGSPTRTAIADRSYPFGLCSLLSRAKPYLIRYAKPPCRCGPDRKRS